ncbi:MAG: ATP-binding cassette domain-containing protein, partial [Pseudomonadota bacterium]
MTPLLQVRNVSKFYGRRIGCADVEFDLYPGEVMGIVGESGSGKSTLLNCLAGHLPPDTGKVIFDTRVAGPVDTVTMSEPERRMLGRTDWAFVHQHARDGLRMSVSAGGNIGERLMAVGARHYGDIRSQAVDWLGRVEIDEARVDDRPTAFSGGMQQRLQIARNLVTGPRLVFMDEPTG